MGSRREERFQDCYIPDREETNSMVSELKITLIFRNLTNFRSLRKLSLCPNGFVVDETGYMSVLLYVNNAEGTTFNVNFQFGLTHSKDQKIQYFVAQSNHNVQDLKNGQGFVKMLSHAALFGATNYVVDGKITIACKVNLLKFRSVLIVIVLSHFSLMLFSKQNQPLI